ncbi:MAG: hypothetical protein ACI3XM_12060 [Eubacteriales bacterium]
MPDSRSNGPKTKDQTNRKKTSPIVTVIYVVGIALAAGAYVFTEASGYMVPGLSPLALAVVITTFTRQHYIENRENKDGMLKPQLAILSLLIAINVIAGLMQIYAAVVS